MSDRLSVTVHVIALLVGIVIGVCFLVEEAKRSSKEAWIALAVRLLLVTVAYFIGVLVGGGRG